MKHFNLIRQELVNWLLILLPGIYVLLVFDKMPQFALFKASDHHKIYQGLIFISGYSLIYYFVLLVKQAKVPNTSIHYNFKSYHKIRTVILIFTCLLSLTFISKLIGISFDWIKVIIILGMFLMTVIGNLIPTIRYKYFIGIRNSATLSSEEIWTKTHRFAGKVFFWGGLIGALYAIIFHENSGPYRILIIIGYVFTLQYLPIGYSIKLDQKLHTPTVLKKGNAHLLPYMWISTVIVFIGAIFKIQHWPFSNIIMIIGLLFGLIFLVFYYKLDTSK